MQPWFARIKRLLKLYGALLPLSVREARPGDLDRIKELIAVQFSSVRHIKSGELAEWLADSQRVPPLIFDVRSEKEYQVSHLRGAVRVDSGNVSKVIGTDRNRPMVFYCSVGYRSSAL